MDLRLAFENKRFVDPLENEDCFNIKKCKILNYEKIEKKFRKII